ncbi:MAG TPA: hypothetical protein DER02_10270 [Gammaproteobacteria bacterium]|nr:hypothetical protein [Gammaproteobacteria bacterium]
MSHPCHNSQIPRLKRAAGQINGVITMVEEGKYCIDILNQVKAARSALTAVENQIMGTHIRECIREALIDERDIDTKIDELMKALQRS